MHWNSNRPKKRLRKLRIPTACFQPLTAVENILRIPMFVGAIARKQGRDGGRQRFRQEFLPLQRRREAVRRKFWQGQSLQFDAPLVVSLAGAHSTVEGVFRVPCRELWAYTVKENPDQLRYVHWFASEGPV
jgi:hypothetical protein